MKLSEFPIPLQFRRSTAMQQVAATNLKLRQAENDFISSYIKRNSHVLTCDTDYITLLAKEQYGIVRPYEIRGLLRYDTFYYDDPSGEDKYDVGDGNRLISIPEFKLILKMVMNKTYPVFNSTYLRWCWHLFTGDEKRKISIKCIREDGISIYIVEAELSVRGVVFKSILENYCQTTNYNLLNIPFNSRIIVKLATVVYPIQIRQGGVKRTLMITKPAVKK